MPIFRTDTQAQVLALLYLRPLQPWTLASLARELHVSASTLHAEVQRLEDAELITSSRIGRSRVIRANLDHPLSRPLTEILEYVYGPRAVIAEEFGRIPGISRLLIFGSWAARHAGEQGHVPHDVDVLVVGDTDRGSVYTAADRAQERIGRPVNAVLASNRRWETDADALIRQIKSSPVIDLSAEARSAHHKANTA
ncbi:MAG TPA: winged helix-turn-helix domain-containing protein [Trebonia sp.]